MPPYLQAQNTCKKGKKVRLIHRNGQFILSSLAQAQAKSGQVAGKKRVYQKGDLVVARFVKAVKGFGITVQLDEKTFGLIEVSEITDDITTNVVSLA